ncbi:MAG: TetR/AcrR family transcriptional regulator [Solirubrobacterales bacterium]
MDTAAATAKTRPAEGERAQRADAQRNRRKVLAAAAERFAEVGLEAQIDDIARAAEVGVGTVYRHFPTKEDLLQALADDRFEGLAAAAREGLSNTDPWAGFCDFMRYSAEVMAEDRGLSEAMDQRPGTCREAAEGAGLPALTAELVGRAQRSGELRQDLVPDDIPSLVCGLGRAVRANPGGKSMHWERYLEIMLAGMRAPARPAP